MNRLPLSVSPQAEREAKKAAQWYEGESQGVGAAFLEVVEQTLSAVSENPRRFPVIYRDTRRALLKRFPYGVFFRLRPTHIKVIENGENAQCFHRALLDQERSFVSLN